MTACELNNIKNDGNINLMIAGEKNGQVYDLEYSGSGDPADSSNWELNVMFDIFEYSGFPHIIR